MSRQLLLSPVQMDSEDPPVKNQSATPVVILSMGIATSQEGAGVNLDGLESYAIIVQGCPDAFMDLVSSHLSVDVRRVGQECFVTSVS